MSAMNAYSIFLCSTEDHNRKFKQKACSRGFGSIFEGTLQDGSKIAVKCLEGLGQVNKSCLAEVESIGSFDIKQLDSKAGRGNIISKIYKSSIIIYFRNL